MRAFIITINAYEQNAHIPKTWVSTHRTEDVEVAIKRSVHKAYGNKFKVILTPRETRLAILRTGYVCPIGLDMTNEPDADQIENSVVPIQVHIQEVQWPIGNVGHPTSLTAGRRRNIYIDDESWKIAIRVGNGNASEGIRLALQECGGRPEGPSILLEPL